MKFFVPHATDDAISEEVRGSVVAFARKTLGWEVTGRRIRRLGYRHNGQDHVAEVGELDPIENEAVILILESNAFLVCTANRGIVRGMPCLVGKDEAYQVEEFDGTPLHVAGPRG